jgi:hypothetical protein
MDSRKAGPAVGRLVRPVHRDDQDLGAEAARHHLQMGLLAGEPARALLQPLCVADAARGDGADLGAEIEAIIEQVGQLVAGGLDGTPIAFRQLA